jgi:hypothetical protein
MQTKTVFMILTALAVLAAIAFFFTKKEKFVGNLSVDSGFYKVDHDQMGGSGFLTDAINQSRSG